MRQKSVRAIGVFAALGVAFALSAQNPPQNRGRGRVPGAPGGVATATRTATGSVTATATRTNTPGNGIVTATPTRTPTGGIVTTTATATPTPGTGGTPASVDECKDGGWRNFTNPTFKNQGDCVSFVASGGRARGNPEQTRTPTPLP